MVETQKDCPKFKSKRRPSWSSKKDKTLTARFLQKKTPTPQLCIFCLKKQKGFAFPIQASNICNLKQRCESLVKQKIIRKKLEPRNTRKTKLVKRIKPKKKETYRIQIELFKYALPPTKKN